MSVARAQRFTAGQRCPVCGGYDGAPRGQGRRCFGFLSEDGAWAHCTREERAGTLELEGDAQTYAHRLSGACRCGQAHGAAAPDASATATARRRIVATYLYSTVEGVPVEVVRYEPKEFAQRRPIPGRPGVYAWHLRPRCNSRRCPCADAALGPATPLLYHVERLTAAIQGGRKVYVVEGERDVETLEGLGLVATTNIGGAGKWRDPYADAFAGAQAVIIADKDKRGRRHAQQVAPSCSHKAGSVKVLELPGEGVKDATDWVSAGGTREALEALADSAREWAPERAKLSAAPGVRSAAERNGPRFLTIEELLARAPRVAEWLLEGYLPRGGVVELVGKVKAAGKTTLVLGWCRAILRGEPFAGRAVRKTSVVYLTEQADASFREALERAGLLDPALALTVLPWHDSLGLPWPEVVAAAVAECRARDAELLVVDTIGQWAGIRGDAENNAGDALEAVRPLQEAAARHRLCVVVVRHARKGTAEVGEDGRGSSAFAGAVDIVLSLRRAEHTTDRTIRVLHALSRFGATPETLALQLTLSGYVALGDEAAFASEIAKRQVLDAAPRGEEHAATEAELLDLAKVRRTSGQEALRVLVELGVLRRAGAGKRGAPYRYWASGSEKVSAADPSRSAAERNGTAADGSPCAGMGSIKGRSQPGTGNDDEVDAMVRAVAEVGLLPRETAS